MCAGFNPYTHILAKEFFDKNWRYFSIAYTTKGYVFTHAGITATWASKYLPTCLSAENYVTELNKAFELRDSNPDYKELFHSLTTIGYMRGGHQVPSPIWADFQELLNDPVPHLNQVVGHTPQQSIKAMRTFSSSLVCCDTFSTMPNGVHFGDCSLLEIDDSGKILTKILD